MAKSDEMDELVAYFYAAGRNAAKQMFNGSLQTQPQSHSSASAIDRRKRSTTVNLYFRDASCRRSEASNGDSPPEEPVAAVKPSSRTSDGNSSVVDSCRVLKTVTSNSPADESVKVKPPKTDVSCRLSNTADGKSSPQESAVVNLPSRDASCRLSKTVGSNSSLDESPKINRPSRDTSCRPSKTVDDNSSPQESTKVNLPSRGLSCQLSRTVDGNSSLDESPKVNCPSRDTNCWPSKTVEGNSSPQESAMLNLSSRNASCLLSKTSNGDFCKTSDDNFSLEESSTVKPTSRDSSLCLSVTSGGSTPRKSTSRSERDVTPVEEIRQSIPQLWSDLTECLAVFVNYAGVTTNSRDIQKCLKIQLSDTLEAMSDKNASCQSLSIPFDNLIHVCDVYGSYGTGVWTSCRGALEAASVVLGGKTLRAVCSLCTDANFRYLETRAVSVRFVCGEEQLADVEEDLLATGMYERDAERLKLAEGTNGMAHGITESVTCIAVQDALHFWAYMGTGWRCRLKEMDTILEDCDISADELVGEDGGQMYLTKPPREGDVLLLVAEGNLKRELGATAIRVRVIEVHQKLADLWCLDFARCITKKWPLLRICPKKIKRIPSQAKLCRIAGLVAKPSVKIVLKCCALLVTLLTRWTFALEESTLSAFFSVFTRLSCGSLLPLRCPSLLCVCVGTTMVASERQSSLIFNNLLAHYVGCIRSLQSAEDICEDLKLELITATQTVCNLLFNFVELRKYFALIGGFPLVMQLVQSKNLDGDLEMALWKLLRVLFGPGDLCKDDAPTNLAVKGEQSKSSNVPEKSPPKGPVPVLPRKSIASLLNKRTLDSWMAVNARMAAGNSLPAVRAVTTQPAAAASREFLIRGKLFQFEPSDSVIALPQRKLNQLTSNRTIETVCGLLNSDAGGAIYFGLGPSNEVDGILMARKQRDDVRLAFDDLLDRMLSPRIGSSSCDLTYIKVFGANEPKDVDRAQHALHVIRVQIKVSPGTYYKLKTSGKYFIIKDGAAKAATTQELREKIIRAAEKTLR